MDHPYIYKKDDIAKIGNTLVYIAERVPNLSKIKLLMLVYLLEETTIRKCARPFLNLDFELWRIGPVAKDIYYDSNVFTAAVKSFDDDEFSEVEMSILDEVTQQYGHMVAKQLINLTQSSQSPWTITAQKNCILERLSDGSILTTDHKIDFNILLDIAGQETYADHLEYLCASMSLKYPLQL